MPGCRVMLVKPELNVGIKVEKRLDQPFLNGPGSHMIE
jgi:hypothetical protein